MVRFVVALSLTMIALPAQAQDKTAAKPMRVMSYNIRNDMANDGNNRWDNRRDAVLFAIRNYDPDLLGMQKVLAAQGDDLQKGLPGYGFAGNGRDDGKRGGEFNPVMFKKDRFELLASGQFWLSPTPEKPGSKGWDSGQIRIMMWAKLKEKPTGATFLFVNTHWDPKGKNSRVESAKLMRKLIEEKREGLPVIITGDFNSNEGSQEHKLLTLGDGKGLQLADAYRIVHPKRLPDEATQNGFMGTKKGSRVDFVFFSPEWKALAATIDYTQKDGRFPSDHYAVTAELERQAAKK
jgi:endonuclease/exonuclease/phosphatase family metal-dependent hydrolase